MSREESRAPMRVAIKRATEAPSGADGMRVLVERRWPAGVAREALALDLWLREAAPSEALQRWAAQDPGRWERFALRYRGELRGRPEVLRVLRELCRRGPLTLLYATREAERSNAAVVRDLLEQPAGRAAGPGRGDPGPDAAL